MPEASHSHSIGNIMSQDSANTADNIYSVNSSPLNTATSDQKPAKKVNLSVQKKKKHNETEVAIKEAEEEVMENETLNPTEEVVSCNLNFSRSVETIHTHLSQQGHTLFSENIRLSKDFFKCKTVNDLLEWQSRIFHLNSNAYLDSTVKLTEVVLQCSSKAFEPLIQQFSQPSEKKERK